MSVAYAKYPGEVLPATVRSLPTFRSAEDVSAMRRCRHLPLREAVNQRRRPPTAKGGPVGQQVDQNCSVGINESPHIVQRQFAVVA